MITNLFNTSQQKHSGLMKNISLRVLLILALLFNHIDTKAQAIKADFLTYDGICVNYSKPLFWGLGYDHNLGDKISIGLTYKKGYFFDEELSANEVEYGFPSANGDVYFSVWHNTSWHEFAYTSKYFFADNTDGSYFVSSGIGLMKAKNEYDLNSLRVDGVYTPHYGDLTEGIYEQDITLIPISIDIGNRGEFDGLYFEWYMGARFLPFGSSFDVEPASLAIHGVETRFQPISFHIALCVGVSWAH